MTRVEHLAGNTPSIPAPLPTGRFIAHSLGVALYGVGVTAAVVGLLTVVSVGLAAALQA